MSIVDRKYLDAKLDMERLIIAAATSAACGWISFYIKERLEELEGLFPGHTFTYVHQVYGTGLTVEPDLRGHHDLDGLCLTVEVDGDFGDPAISRLLEIVEEVGNLAVTVEDEFNMNPGLITTADDDVEVTA